MKEEYMLQAIELAKKGKGWTNPNPLVGAVIVKDDVVIGEGYHEKYGELHAERNAIASLKESAKGATIYVTLEPCCHYGKTPPCTEAIIENEIAKVVIGSRDPNPLVAGKGVKRLKEAGIEVVEDFLKEECDALNPVFFHYMETKRPYVNMKYAMTADGKIATRTGASKWVTGEASRAKVQELRSENLGIMVGIGTVLADDPMLNVRIEGKRSPIRIICDSHLQIPLDSKICNTAKTYPTIIAALETADAKKKAELESLGIQVWTFEGEKVDLIRLMEELGKEKIDSILLEGGGTLNESMLSLGLVEEVHLFMAPKIFGGEQAKSPVEGMGAEVPAEATKLQMTSVDQIGEDLYITYKVRR